MGDEALGWLFTVLWFGYWAVVSAISLILGVTIPPAAVLMLARMKEGGTTRRTRRRVSKRQEPESRTSAEKQDAPRQKSAGPHESTTGRTESQEAGDHARESS